MSVTDWDKAVDLVLFVRAQHGIFAVAQNYPYDGISAVPGTLTYPLASVWDMSCHHFDNLPCSLGPVAEVTAHAYRALEKRTVKREDLDS